MTGPLKGQCRYFDQGEIDLTFLRNEFIVKLRNLEMGPSYGRNGKYKRFLFK